MFRYNCLETFFSGTNMKTVHLMLLANVVLLSAIAGCGGPKVVPVKGIAMYQGKPVANLILHFSSSDGRTSTGMTDEIGHTRTGSTVARRSNQYGYDG